MFGKKKPLSLSGKSLFLGDLEESELRPAENEQDPSDEIQIEHVSSLAEETLVKPSDSGKPLPQRRPLANPEAMPKPKPKPDPKTVKITAEKVAEVKALPETKKAEGTAKQEEKPAAEAKKRPLLVKKELIKKVEKAAPLKPLSKEEKENLIRQSLDGMYDVYRDPEMAPAKKIAVADMVRYAVLFVCIAGFLTAGVFVFNKIYDYYRSYVVYSGLQEMVSEKDYFQSEYLKKSEANVNTLTPGDILNGKKEEQTGGNDTYTDEQQNLVNKIGQLKKINPDTAGWITIDGTVVNYPVVWSEVKNYYLRRDFYGKVLSGGTIYIDERNSPVVAENRNTVIYGHNMTDGSMFASIHDFANATVFYNATIEIATEEGIFVYKPFSAHESNAYDNYFETDFQSDADFIDFCDQMAFISLYQTDFTFDKNTQIITLSTCANDETTKDDRFAVHAVLTKVIR